MDFYKKNSGKNNSMHDEIREQNAKLKNAPLKDKLIYFKDYYLKPTLIIIVAFCFVVNLAYTMITAPRETAFAAYFINDTGDSSDTGLADDFAQYMGINTKKAECYIDAAQSYSSSESDYDSYLSIQKVMAVIAGNDLDVIVGDEQTATYYGSIECFYDVTKILPDDLMEKFKDKLFYTKVGESGELVPVGIYITDAPKIIEHYYYTDKDAIMGFIINSENIDTSIEFLRFIYE
jgi:hypothetical protein